MTGPSRSTRSTGLVSLALLAVLWLRSKGWPLPLPGCPWRAWTGIPCPTCFLTRSVMASLHGDLGEALELHVFGPPSVVGLAWIGWRQGVRGHSLPKLTPSARQAAGDGDCCAADLLVGASLGLADAGLAPARLMGVRLPGAVGSGCRCRRPATRHGSSPVGRRHYGRHVWGRTPIRGQDCSWLSS